MCVVIYVKKETKFENILQLEFIILNDATV